MSHTPETWYLLAAVGIGFLITLGLRAIPFAVLKRLRASKLVQALGRWMPAGVLVILAVVVLGGEVVAHPDRVWKLAVASAATVAVHLLVRRRAALSIAAGTVVYVALVNLV